jgi:hypothetical protein
MKTRLSILLILALVLAACSIAGDKQGAAPEAVNTVSNYATPAPAQSSALNAGEIDDNAQWDYHLRYRNDYLVSGSRTVHDVNVSQRQIITVSDPQGLPVLGARVMVYGEQTLLAESRTYATGQTLFFPSAWAQDQQVYRVVVQKDDTAVEFTLDPQASSEWLVTLELPQQQETIPLDVLFLLDSTGSMADEIEQLQDNILSISSSIAQLPGDVDVHYGLVTYRDRGDEYVTRSVDFVPDVQQFQAELSMVCGRGRRYSRIGE